ncbi:MAG: hydroxyethylthiazole kinase [Alistipes sp.]|nr:hydroxyethylthiazole kinase [Candidatus Minthomonas equi]
MVSNDLEAVRNSSPLIHNVTNYVVMNLTANALLSIGARPVMSDALPEAGEMTAVSDALILNIGTLSERWEKSMMESAATASALGIPIVLDPVGAGITSYRLNFVRRMLESFSPQIIKGNTSEIKALLSICHQDEPHLSESKNPAKDAESLALFTGSTVIVTGSTDYISDGHRISRISNGSPIMARTTGMGCTAAALAGAFLSVTDDTFRAAVSTMTVMGIAGQRAAEHSRGNGSFQVCFLDELYNMNRETINENLIWEE